MNPLKGEVPLTLKDGRKYTLVIDMEALIEAESAYGKPLQQMMQDAAARFVGALRAILFGAMRAKHPDVTLRDASGIIMSDAEAVGTALSAAVGAGFPDVSEGKDGPRPRGKTSGANGVKPA